MLIAVFVILFVVSELYIFEKIHSKKSSFSPDLVPPISFDDHRLKDVLKYDAAGNEIKKA